MATVGVIGTGAIGSRICGRLALHGNDVLAWDLSPPALAAAAARGARPAPSAAAVARECPVVILCLTDERSVEDVLLGQDSISADLQPGALVIDTTSSAPSVTRRAATALAERRVELIDAPVSRGVPAAEAGTLSIMAGGSESAYERALPVLRQFGTDVYHAGPIGSGHAAKALNMLLLGVAMTATAEALAIGRSAGLHEEQLLTFINSHSGQSYASQVHYVKWVLPRTFQAGFTMALMEKDVRIGVEMAHELGLPTLVTGRLHDLYRLALRHVPPDTDHTHLASLIFRWSGQAPDAGGVAAGQINSLLDHLVATVNLTAALEVLLIGARYGLDPERLLGIINASSGRSLMTDEQIPREILTRRFDSRVSLGSIYSEIQGAVRLAIENHIPLFLGDLSRQICAIGIQTGMAAADITRLAGVMESLLGQPLKEGPDTNTS